MEPFLPSQTRILAATPDAVTRDALQELLADCGYVTEGAFDIASAAAKIQSLRPQVLLADTAFRGEGTRSLIAMLRGVDPKAQAAVLTNHHELDAARIAEHLGAHAFLNRPLDFPQVISVVGSLASIALVAD